MHVHLVYWYFSSWFRSSLFFLASYIQLGCLAPKCGFPASDLPLMNFGKIFWAFWGFSQHAAFCPHVPTASPGIFTCIQHTSCALSTSEIHDVECQRLQKYVMLNVHDYIYSLLFASVVDRHASFCLRRCRKFLKNFWKFIFLKTIFLQFLETLVKFR